ncbi:MAG: hypothetical protein U0984_06205 [Prosthecobacter sp.]|nr:hypothetical protein [Prosthecobacter sp.]
MCDTLPAKDRWNLDSNMGALLAKLLPWNWFHVEATSCVKSEDSLAEDAADLALMESRRGQETYSLDEVFGRK